MDNLIVYVILSLVAGALVWTLGKYAWKIHAAPSVTFNHSYLLTMLFSMVAVVALTPLVAIAPLHSLDLVPGGVWFSVGVAFAVGFTFNVIVNWPITHLINKIEGLKKTAATCAPPVTQAASSSIKTPRIDIHKLLLAIVIVGLVIALIVSSGVAIVTYSASISGTGSITSVGVSVYSDSQGQVSLNSVNWGNVAPGGSITTTIYVKNSGNTPIALYLSSANWTPSSISSALTLTWDYNNATIQPGSIMKVNLTLAASQNAPQGQSFAVNIIITATG